jgi:NADH-quinone oxidoreductase subunit C
MYDQLISDFKAKFSDALFADPNDRSLPTTDGVSQYKGELTFHVKKSSVHAVCEFLKTELGFNYCSDICGADRFTESDRFEVIYNLFNLKTKVRLRLKTRVDEHDCHVQTVSDIWQSADWFERETFDMYGVKFTGHPDLRRMYLPEDFEYYPLRKEYPLVGIPGSIPLPTADDDAQKLAQHERYNKGESV